MRLLIKLSGESLRGENENSKEKFSLATIDTIVKKISILRNNGHQVALVVGGGNLFRGHELTSTLHIDRATADYVGMLATVQNSLVLRDCFELNGIETRVSSAITMPQISEGYMPRRVLRHLEKSRLVIFAAGLGAPYFSTDSTAVQRALEMKADLLVMAKNGVDGLYTADPDKDSSVTIIKKITAAEVLEKNLKIADQSAIALAKENSLTIKIVSVDDIENCLDDAIGSIIKPD